MGMKFDEEIFERLQAKYLNSVAFSESALGHLSQTSAQRTFIDVYTLGSFTS